MLAVEIFFFFLVVDVFMRVLMAALETPATSFAVWRFIFGPCTPCMSNDESMMMLRMFLMIFATFYDNLVDVDGLPGTMTGLSTASFLFVSVAV